MPTSTPKLASIRTFDQLLRYLEDELEWPIDEMEIDDLTFDYDAEEDLGLDPKSAAKIKAIKQLRPLDARQPFGIFFIEFEPKSLPVVVMRRILGKLVARKRESANPTERKTYTQDDLLFISACGEDKARRIDFAHFANDAQNGLPTLRVLGWDGDDTNLKLDFIESRLRQNLLWPENADPQLWRQAWRDAFVLRHREVVDTSKKLATRLAELAQSIRARVTKAMSFESKNGPLTTLMNAFRESLIHDLEPDDFADMYAQTIAYGLLSARVSRPTDLVADNLADMVPVTNPFLKELMETFLNVGGRKWSSDKGKLVGIDFDELGVNEVVDTLRDANMEAVLRDFDNRNPQEDPVLHFYEHFLKEYDAKKRMQRGVFYTPKPVVSYIVRSVHELLQTEFRLPLGLADTTTWSEMVSRNDELKIPEGTSPDSPFVQILDPATGTATFLVEVIDLIHKTMIEHWESEGVRGDLFLKQKWNEYVPRHLLPRLHGYELMMAPYAIAHMKIGLKLFETGYTFEGSERARIYLTNALEPPQDFSDTFEQMAPALAHEAQAVNDVKRYQRFTVVVGNPPYSVSSWNTGDWITSLAEDYKRTVRAEESQIQSLSNDYIKFLRLAEWYIERGGSGIVGMITGHGYLHGTQPRDLRDHMSQTFAEIMCLDLHGSIRRAGTDDVNDEPVFEIMTGVAITIALARSVDCERGITMLSSLTGRLATKCAYLARNTAADTAAACVGHVPAPQYFHFAPVSTAADVATEYQNWLELPDIFGTGSRSADKETFWATGFASQQDDLAISFSRAEVEEKMEALAASRTFEELNDKYRLCTTNQWSYDEAKRFSRCAAWQEHVSQVAYRPFDRRWTVQHKSILTILRKQVMSQLTGVSADNVGLISSRAVNDLDFAHCFVTKEPVDKIFISSKTSTNAYVFPLFVWTDGLQGRQRRPNVSERFVSTLVQALRVADNIRPHDILCYIYSILNGPSYRARYREFLKIDFPRIPLPSDVSLFSALATLGSELSELHLMESPVLDKPIAKFKGPVNPEVEKVNFEDATVWLDKAKTRGFVDVPEEVWNFHIGGYQVCHKWLKDRQAKGGKNPRPGRVLTDDDIAHYCKIVTAIHHTIRIMGEIDEVIEAHGGWPDAFITEKQED